MRLFITFAIAFLFIFSSCTTQKSAADANQPKALKSQWILLNEDTGKPYRGMQDKPVTLEFDYAGDATINGYSGCNQYGGQYTLDGNNIQFRNLYSTKMACPDIDIENKYLSLLNDVTRYQVRGKSLEFYKDQILLLKFTK